MWYMVHIMFYRIDCNQDHHFVHEIITIAWRLAEHLSRLKDKICHKESSLKELSWMMNHELYYHFVFRKRIELFYLRKTLYRSNQWFCIWPTIWKDIALLLDSLAAKLKWSKKWVYLCLSQNVTEISTMSENQSGLPTKRQFITFNSTYRNDSLSKIETK